METLFIFIVGGLCGAINFAIGFYLGQMQRTQSRALSPTTSHPAPSIARRAERIAIQATKRSKAEQIKVISPRKKAQSNLVDLES